MCACVCRYAGVHMCVCGTHALLICLNLVGSIQPNNDKAAVFMFALAGTQR